MNTMYSNNNSSDTISSDRSSFPIKDYVLKYLTYFPLFLLFLVLSLGMGYVYLRYTTKIYKVGASMLVGGTDAVNRSADNDLLNSAINGTRTVNIQNEIEAMRSRVLLEKLVTKNHFNIYYYNLGKIKNSDISEYAPFQLVALSVPDSQRNYTVDVAHIKPRQALISYNKGIAHWINWGDTLQEQGFRFVLQPASANLGESVEPFQVVWKPIGVAVGEIQGRLAIGGLSDKTSILTFGMQTDNPSRGAVILNQLMQEVVERDIELKKETSVQTIRFINDRLDTITQELARFENQMAAIRNDPRFPEIADLYNFYNKKIDDAESQIKKIRQQQDDIGMLENFLNNPTNQYVIVPFNLMMDESPVNGLLKSYNELIINYNNELKTNQPNSFVLKGLSNKITELRNELIKVLVNLSQESRSRLKATLYQQDSLMIPLLSLPGKSRELAEVQRQKKIKEDLFAYLLQKREETSITSLSAKSNYTILNMAGVPSQPAEPIPGRILGFCSLLGIIIPVSLIFLMEVFNDKVTTKEDITRKSTIPIVGEIVHSDNNALLVVQHNRSAIAEQFRILRANLQFLFKDAGAGCKTILVTSSIAGEGKSFTSTNLAAVLSLTGKKVALLQFDVRKVQPSITDHPDDRLKDKGLVNYLIGQVTDPAILLKPVDKYPHLQVIESGPIPPNPAELLLSDKMVPLFTYLKSHFDYIVLDTAPVGLVSDAFLLSGYADVVLFIIRQRVTHKRQLEFVDDLARQGKLTHLALIVNDVQVAGRYGYYGYSSYAYAYRYGYKGYGYFGNKSDKNPYFNTYFDSPGAPLKKGGWLGFLRRK